MASRIDTYITFPDGDAAEVLPQVVTADLDVLPQAMFLEMQSGAGLNSTVDGARRVVVPAASVYPDEVGVSFFVNDVFNRTDPTGRNEGSEYHTYPCADLAPGDVVRAEWTDTNLEFHSYECVTPTTISVPSGSVFPNVVTVFGSAGSPSVSPTPTTSSGEMPTTANTGTTGTLTSVASFGTSFDGQIIENISTGSIDVYHNNVTIRNCKFTSGLYKIDIHPGTSGTLIEDCEIDNGPIASSTNGGHGIYLRPGTAGRPQNVTVRRCNIHRVKIGIGGHVTNLLVEDCYIWDNWYTTGSHTTCVSLDGCQGAVYRGNSFEMPNPGASSCTALYARNPIDDVLYEGNWYAGGAYALNGGHGSAKEFDATNVEITGNFFRTTIYPDCGNYGPIRNSNGPTHTLSGNVWFDPTNTHHTHLSSI